MKNKLYIAAAVLFAGFGFQACTAGGDDPGVEYAPDMYVSKGWEPMSQLADKEYHIVKNGQTIPLTKDGKTMREPVKGTIPMDLKFLAGNTQLNNSLLFQYPYEKNADGYEAAKTNLKNPLPLTQENLEVGRVLYNINCLPCHGEKGLGDGAVAAKFPPKNIPSYKSDRILNLPDGGKYHSITHGINLMGSYASVLTPEERWKVIHYVNYLSKN